MGSMFICRLITSFINIQGLTNAVQLYISEKEIGDDYSKLYKYMDIGTAKPDEEEFLIVPHHLYDILEPDEEFNVSLFKDLVKKTIGKIEVKKSIPLIVGGTGQYIWSLLEDWQFAGGISQSKDFSDVLESRLESEGLGSLVKDLKEKSPESVPIIDLQIPRRVIRALERLHQGLAAVTPRPRRPSIPQDTLIVGLSMPRQQLYLTVDQRFAQMVERGFVPEVNKLINMGYKPGLKSMDGIGYREICEYLTYGCTWQNTTDFTKSRTHRLIRTQSNWFRPDDNRINWFDVSATDIAKTVDKICFLYQSC